MATPNLIYFKRRKSDETGSNDRTGENEFRDVDIPKINPDEVLIKTHRIGICGSDIHVYHGKHPYTSYPIVQGHEISGEIAKVGEMCKALKKET